VAETWDGTDLKLTLGDQSSLMTLWFELVSIAEGNKFTDENGHIVWSFSSSEKYIVQSLYTVINYRVKF
jgi:hypothetical protein